ncbi:MAG TPA: nickel pincer cofactor biosynthesis protein LarC [Vicinamibacterales bacterium]|nr:nickel pincer cofactor biosynthesis protein LarC [Vicinamibacterales bacterium]
MGRVMYFDCPAGAAGDMILGALLDAGLPIEALRDALGSLGVDHHLHVDRVVRAGISANHVRVAEPPERSAEHDHRGADHTHRSLDGIFALIGSSALSAAGKAQAVALFQRIGEAEAAIHGVPVDRIHLHEVGEVDSIIDIVGAVFAFQWFGIDDIVSSPLNVGAGTVSMAHGTFPVPAPATLRLLTGVPVYSSGMQAELVTPTGALLVSAYAGQYGPMPAMRVDRIGYGAGTRDLDPLPNVLRVVVGERLEPGAVAAAGAGQVVEIVCAIDDMSPEWFGALSERLFDAGALDVYLAPVQMKKGRPGTLVTVLGPVALRAPLSAVLFAESTTIGLRWQVVDRETLDRRHETVVVEGGEVRIKVALRNGAVVNAAPEYDDCRRVSAATGRPVKQVHAEALGAWFGRRRG